MTMDTTDPTIASTAADLVKFIKNFNLSTTTQASQGFGTGVAGFPEGHPQTPNRMHEMDYLKAKVDSGADYICTQLFFDNHDFFDFRERCNLAGLMYLSLQALCQLLQSQNEKNGRTRSRLKISS